MNPGLMNKWVTLSRSPQTTPDSDGFFEDLNPKGVWAQLQPLPPQDNDRVAGSLITIRFHPQVTEDTRVVYADPILGRDREFFVKGVQVPDEARAEMRLYCEEVAP